MHVDGKPYRTIWWEADSDTVRIIDQRRLPFAFEIETLPTTESVAVAIHDMHVRGAGCIGATAGFGLYLAAKEAREAGDFSLEIRRLADRLVQTRPTAVNLRWAVDRQLAVMASVSSVDAKVELALKTAIEIADEDAESCRSIGKHGLELIRELAAGKAENEPVRILTHCNAGWLAFVDHGSATAPIYAAKEAGIPIEVWVDETRPRNQGARLTAWELGAEGVPHTVIADNVGGHLMQQGLVDLVITGTDRTTHTGDVANKIGTYLKALAAQDNEVPFFVALPSSTFDWEISDGVGGIPIEQRGGEEVSHLSGLSPEGEEIEVRLTPPGSPCANYAFDVTPARLVTGLITERGICDASREGIGALFPEFMRH